MPSGCTPTPPGSRSDAGCTTGAVGPCPGRAPTAAPCPPPEPWLRDTLAFMCPQDRAFLDDLRARGVTVTAYDRIYFDDPYYDGTRWTTRRFEAGGTTSGTQINMLMGGSPSENAATLYHEGVHTGQPASMPWREKEYQAYIAEDRWRIAHGMPPHQPDFRTHDSAGNPVTDASAVRRFVDREYPGVTSTPASGGSPEQVIGRDASGNTVVQRADGTTYARPPRAGDSYAGPQVSQPPGGRRAQTCQLRCP